MFLGPFNQNKYFVTHISDLNWMQRETLYPLKATMMWPEHTCNKWTTNPRSFSLHFVSSAIERALVLTHYCSFHFHLSTIKLSYKSFILFFFLIGFLFNVFFFFFLLNSPQIQCKEILLEDMDISKGLIEGISKYSVELLVLGAASRSGLVR